MPSKLITINRAPVLTLWASVVAERFGCDRDESLSLAKAVAGLNAQAKGRRLGIFEPPRLAPGERPKKSGLGEERWIELCGRAVPVKDTDSGVRAVVKDKPIEPGAVQTYLEKAFGDDLTAARRAMRELAASYGSDELAEQAFALYEQFRPTVAKGTSGWGQKGTLDLGVIRSLRRRG